MEKLNILPCKKSKSNIPIQGKIKEIILEFFLEFELNCELLFFFALWN
jgi:hypothetical protein